MNDKLKEETQSRAMATLAVMIEDVYRDDPYQAAIADLPERMAQVVEQFKRAAALVSAIG